MPVKDRERSHIACKRIMEEQIQETLNEYLGDADLTYEIAVKLSRRLMTDLIVAGYLHISLV